jgi:hypothetical protein
VHQQGQTWQRQRVRSCISAWSHRWQLYVCSRIDVGDDERQEIIHPFASRTSTDLWQRRTGERSHRQRLLELEKQTGFDGLKNHNCRFSKTWAVKGGSDRFKSKRDPPQSTRRDRTIDRPHKKRRTAWKESYEVGCCNIGGRVRVCPRLQSETSNPIFIRKNKDCGIKEKILLVLGDKGGGYSREILRLRLRTRHWRESANA